jgi:uncharacterized protein YgiM (DUF1202 family)
VYLRTTSSWSARTSGTVARGEIVTLVSERADGWTQVRTANGRTGWIHQVHLTRR